MLEQVTANSEVGLDLNQSREAERVDWRSLARILLLIVSRIENATTDCCHQEVQILPVVNILRDLVRLESNISLHLEFVLSGSFRYSDHSRQAMKHIQEYEDRLNSAQGNRVYQRQGHRSKSFRAKSGEFEKVQGVKYTRSRTAELPSITSKTAEQIKSGLTVSKSASSVKMSQVKEDVNNNSVECHQIQSPSKFSSINQMYNRKSLEQNQLGVKASKSDSTVKILPAKLDENYNSGKCHQTQRHRKISLINQMSNMFRNIL